MSATRRAIGFGSAEPATRDVNGGTSKQAVKRAVSETALGQTAMCGSYRDGRRKSRRMSSVSVVTRSATVVQSVDAMSEPPKRFVYVLRSLKDPTRQYVGRTYDIASRLASHNAGESPYTTKHRPWQVVALVQFLSEERAEEFQKFLKSASGRVFTKQYFL